MRKRSNEDFDFSNYQDQKQFSSLSKGKRKELTEEAHETALEMEKLLEYERAAEYETVSDGVKDFARICSEGLSVAGNALRDALENVKDIKNPDELKGLLQKADEIVREYDKEDSPPGRIVDYEYVFEGNKAEINYETCEGTKMRCDIDFGSGTSKVGIEGKASSVIRRSSAVNEAAKKFEPESGKEILPKLVTEVLTVADKFNAKFDDEKVKGVNGHPLRLKVSFDLDPDKPDFPKTINVDSTSYYAFYGYADKLNISKHSCAEVEPVTISEGDDIDAKIGEFYDKLIKYADQVVELEKEK